MGAISQFFDIGIAASNAIPRNIAPLVTNAAGIYALHKGMLCQVVGDGFGMVTQLAGSDSVTRLRAGGFFQNRFLKMVGIGVYGQHSFIFFPAKGADCGGFSRGDAGRFF